MNKSNDFDKKPSKNQSNKSFNDEQYHHEENKSKDKARVFPPLINDDKI